MNAVTKRAEDVAIGDVLVVLGEYHRIVEIEPYTHPQLGEMVGIARAEDGWGFTLEPGARIFVV